MKAMIFAAGLGTRLKPLTDTMPKALVPVGGKPLLEILIRKLKASGFDEVVINVHHFADQIIRFVNENEGFGLNIRISDETACLLETGGAIKKAVPLLSGSRQEEEPFMIHNVDILSNLDFGTFMNCQSADSERAATLLVSKRETSRQLLFDKENRLVGWYNRKTNEIKTPYSGLDLQLCRQLAFSGIHLFSPRLFPYFTDWPDRFSIIDFYLSVCDKESVIGYEYPELKLMDVGKLDTLSAAEDFLINECC